MAGGAPHPEAALSALPDAPERRSLA